MEIKTNFYVKPDIKLDDSKNKQIEDFINDIAKIVKEKINTYSSWESVKNRVKTVYLTFSICDDIVKDKKPFVLPNSSKKYYFFLDYDKNSFKITDEEEKRLGTILQIDIIKNKVSEFLEKIGCDSLILIMGLDKEFKLNIKPNNSSEDGLTVFVPMEPRFSFENLILEEETKEELDKVLHMIDIRHKLYEEWGFKKIDPVPRIILNFYGPPGTGKTTTAHAIAKKLEKKILALNYAEIESKYVGDAPKNLVKAFETAHKENAVLFFDEADSFLGKRITSVSSSSDQAVNSLRSQMIILLDSFPDMIIIFSTNLIHNYDRAFESRIFKHIKFDLPKKENRIKIIQQMIPNEVPFENGQRLTEEQLAELSDLLEGFSGREIKNAVLDTLISVLFEGRNFVTFEDFKKNFTKAKESKEKLEKEYKSNLIDPFKKKELEEKIKNELKKQSSSENQQETEENLAKAE